MSGERVQALKERADIFLELADEMLARGRTDMASFFTEQACQLRLKATILRVFGYTPRIHGIRELLGLLAKELEESGYDDLASRVVEFTRTQRDILVDIEYSYTEARYGLPTLSTRQVQEMIEVAQQLFRLLSEVEESVLG